MSIRAKFEDGFTLVELLVVIAIIAVLATIVVVNLSSARGTGEVAGVKTAMAQLRTQGNLYFNANGDYGTASANGSCSTANTVFVDQRFSDILGSVQSSAHNAPVCRSIAGGAGAWVVSVQMSYPDGGNYYMCVDSAGILKSHPNPLGAVTACP